VQTPTPTARGTVYVVRTGDNLSGIAARFKVSMRAILAANPSITNTNQITIGQRIVIPHR
jgi:LysM repeat protein